MTRLAEDAFLVVTSGACQVRDFHWLKGHVQDHEHCIVTDVTSGHAVIGVAGPRSRDLLATLTPESLANDAFSFGASREVEFAMAKARMTRISYAGELGWEIMVPTEFAAHVYEAVTAAGRDFGLVHAGMHAMNSLRIEKAYRHWGHDISDEDTVLEAGLGFAVAWDKPGGFIGREALLKQREAGITRRLLQFLVTDPDPLLYHNEPIWRDGQIVGKVTSGMYGHTLGGAVGMGYVTVPEDGPAGLGDHAYEIEIAGARYPARASLKPLYDPASFRLRG